MAKNKKRSSGGPANGKKFETKLVYSSTSTSNIGENMAKNEKRSSYDLTNGEKSKTNEAQDSVNAGTNNAKQLKKPKIDLERVRAPGPINHSILVLQLSTR